MDKITVLKAHYNLSGNIDFLEGAENLLDKVHRQALKEVKRETVEITEEEIQELAIKAYHRYAAYGILECWNYIKLRINQ